MMVKEVKKPKFVFGKEKSPVPPLVMVNDEDFVKKGIMSGKLKKKI